MSEKIEENSEIVSKDEMEVHQKLTFSVFSVTEALELLAKTFANTKSTSIESLQEFVFNINSKLHRKPDKASCLFYLKSAQSVLIVFKSVVNNNEAILFWRSSISEELKSVESNGTATEFCQNFLVQEIKRGRNGNYDLSYHYFCSFKFNQSKNIYS